MKTQFNSSFEYILEEIDEMIESSSSSLQVLAWE